MELRLKGYGTIEITNATLVDGGDILIETTDNFHRITEVVGYEITEAFLVENDFGWDIVIWLDIPDDDWFTQRTIITEIENQEDVYRLNALL